MKNTTIPQNENYLTLFSNTWPGTAAKMIKFCISPKCKNAEIKDFIKENEILFNKGINFYILKIYRYRLNF